jgi:hypothetical protein
MNKKIVFILLGLGLLLKLEGQNYYRISGEFTIKTKADSAAQLVMGKFYFDKNKKKIVHDTYFPEKVTWITSDTSVYKIVENTIVLRQSIPDFSAFSIYNMVLNNQLDNFGLDNTYFSLENVEEEGSMVISTWMPNKSLKKATGKILISSKDNNIYGIVFFNTEDQIVKKQFFEDYTVNSGLAFPGRIVEITYVKGKEVYQVTTYKNIVINEKGNENLYGFNPADYRSNIGK